ncbi:UDP-N-acetylmuramate--alanine ligase [Porphyromonas crevioricanis]|uniref:UDP-N-acetylmuramate--L-alanine ligase n=1 Tax=Porphyromonas crevioricanis JCM 15906 TaxID=1305617 RepID=T1DRC3_9PORP|nr:UDP-N-acetylmuramate--L-alanine ligase [Porphyromonas crevioricanis]KGN91342.1 UDP-N-acetylmuramate--alanine ligase [Porphyromonas crevioricanis]GAD04784.1 UDP-N-acetylmuramate-alanine ligase [Porphyromonas crevioricanis JCM 15906]SJZ98138.1 UDP-N-acetylmuramate--L-alanine ligase [Porphyromonas crevioricanis]
MKRVYFIGIGGIGMSAIARYFSFKGMEVAGYDLTSTPLTDKLKGEGIAVHFEDKPELIPPSFRDVEETLVVYTPAVPPSHQELTYFREGGYKVLKRAEVLGEITRMGKALCVAGTHGKTTTSTLLAHLLRSSEPDCSAFLGGISVNYGSNYLLSPKSDLIVVEADEYDRSFHRLSPYMAIVTSTDPDHLDIYGTPENYIESFKHFVSLIESGGALVMKKGLDLASSVGPDVQVYTYSAQEEADYYASNIRFQDGHLLFDWYAPNGLELRNLDLGVPLRINVENAVAALAVASLNGASMERLRAGIASFRGAQRRFERIVDSSRVVFISDYAHHPAELEASLQSVRELYRGKRILGIFQPHLYSRTADFYREFAKSLSALDEVVLVDIYPAREEPLPGVSSHMIADLLPGEVPVLALDELLPHVRQRNIPDVVIVLGAGDIDREVPHLAEYLRSL